MNSGGDTLKLDTPMGILESHMAWTLSIKSHLQTISRLPLHTFDFSQGIMTMLFSSLLAALLCVHGVNAVGTAFGYGTGTTGGGSAAAAVPTSTSQLITW